MLTRFRKQQRSFLLDYDKVRIAAMFEQAKADTESETPRSAQDVIDQAIAENRFGEHLLYAFAMIFVTVGLTVLVWAALKREPVIGVAGALSSGLFWPAMSAARRTRKETIAIRLLEAPLSRADTAKEASEMLHQLFKQIFGDLSKDG